MIKVYSPLRENVPAEMRVGFDLGNPPTYRCYKNPVDRARAIAMLNRRGYNSFMLVSMTSGSGLWAEVDLSVKTGVVIVPEGKK